MSDLKYWQKLEDITRVRILELEAAFSEGRVVKKYEWWTHKTLQSNKSWHDLAVSMIHQINGTQARAEQRIVMAIKTFRGNDED